jgi:hypothetical protein
LPVATIEYGCGVGAVVDRGKGLRGREAGRHLYRGISGLSFRIGGMETNTTNNRIKKTNPTPYHQPLETPATALLSRLKFMNTGDIMVWLLLVGLSLTAKQSNYFLPLTTIHPQLGVVPTRVPQD